MRNLIFLVLLLVSPVSAWADSLVGEIQGDFLGNPGLHGRFTVGAIQIELSTGQQTPISNNSITPIIDFGIVRIPEQLTPYRIIGPGRDCVDLPCATAVLTFAIFESISTNTTTFSSNAGVEELTTITYPVHLTGEIDFPDRPALLLDEWGTALETFGSGIK